MMNRMIISQETICAVCIIRVKNMLCATRTSEYLVSRVKVLSVGLITASTALAAGFP